MHVPLRASIVDTDEERYGTFRGSRASERRVRKPKSVVVAMFALALLAALLFYSSPLAPDMPRSHVIDDTTSHSAQSTPLLSNAENGATRSVHVFYRADTGVVDVEFGNDSTIAANENVPTRPDAWATFNDSLLAIGWSQLWVNTTELNATELADPVRAQKRRRELMFAAGYAEAALTHQRIDEHFTNVYLTFFPTNSTAEQATLAALQGFLRENLAWMREQVAYYDSDASRVTMPDAPYWAAIGSVLAQFDGLVQGYTRFSNKREPVSEIDLFLLNADGDIEDLIPAIQQRQQHTQDAPAAAAVSAVITEPFYTFVKNLKCSALIRILPDFVDLVWGHATWDTYSSMNRIFKHYELPLPSTDANGGPLQSPSARRKISMSSSPGYLSSVDDWYLTSAGLGVMETTHGVFNNDLYAFVTSKSVLCWLRSKVANLLAEDGMSWAATFSKFNSGTYNDQWMIVDTKQFKPGHGFSAHGLIVLEQLPGLIHVEDVSTVVNARGYWASYNVPYFESVYARSGFRAAYLATNESASWSHANCSRAKIFARDAPAIRSLDDLKRVMRSNNWQSDPLASGHASHAVAARYDLETDPALFALDGAIDAKVTSWTRLQHGRLECDAVSGPTHDQTPVFEWTDALAAMAAHVGQPQRFDFEYETMVHDRN